MHRIAVSRMVMWLEPRDEDTVRPIAKLAKIEPSVTFKIIFASLVTAEFSLVVRRRYPHAG